METHMTTWLEKNNYKLFAEDKGYSVYENGRMTIVIDPSGVLIIMKAIEKPTKGEILFGEDGWKLIETSPCGIQLWEKYGLYVYYHPKLDIFSKMYLEHPKEVFKKYGIGGLK